MVLWKDKIRYCEDNKNYGMDNLIMFGGKNIYLNPFMLIFKTNFDEICK